MPRNGFDEDYWQCSHKRQIYLAENQLSSHGSNCAIRQIQSETMKPAFSEKFVESTYSYWVVMT